MHNIDIIECKINVLPDRIQNLPDIRMNNKDNKKEGLVRNKLNEQFCFTNGLLANDLILRVYLKSRLFWIFINFNCLHDQGIIQKFWRSCRKFVVCFLK